MNTADSHRNRGLESSVNSWGGNPSSKTYLVRFVRFAMGHSARSFLENDDFLSSSEGPVALAVRLKAGLMIMAFGVNSSGCTLDLQGLCLAGKSPRWSKAVG